jgi:site-specific recombinase XerD
MRSREDLGPAEPKTEASLTDLAVHANVAAATQNVAMNALVFLYERVLHQALTGSINLRVKDIDVSMKQLTVHADKGNKDRFTTFPATLTPLLQNHLARVKTLHQQDLAQGHGAEVSAYG